ncbi:MAG: efflux RND transporter permease subunit, partial [Chloroflexi bacterium]|nr:efflux RND transporter permease subunit [Chloroflexota bacterium]
MPWWRSRQCYRNHALLLLKNMPLSLLLIFVMLYSTFGSARLGSLIYLNVPLAITGGILALLLRGYPFS